MRGSMDSLQTTTWVIDWVLSLPLILLTVIVHVFGLAFINDAAISILKDIPLRRRFMYRFAVVSPGPSTRWSRTPVARFQ